MLVIRGNQNTVVWRWQALDKDRQQCVCVNDGFSIPLAILATNDQVQAFMKAVGDHSLTLVGQFQFAFEFMTPAG